MKNKIFAVYFIFAGMLTACGSTEVKQETQLDSVPVVSENIEEETDTVQGEEADEDEYKISCHSFEYKEYFRNDQTYKGEKIRVDVQVAQVMEGDLRAYDVNGNEYYISDMRGDGDKFRVIENDELTVYGEYGGTEKFTRAIGNYETEVFYIIGKYFELHEETTENLPGVSDGTDSYEPDEGTSYYKEVYVDSSYDINLEYIFPDSDTRLLTETDVAGGSSEWLRIAKNEIYARHGRIFTSEDLSEYFGSKTWYQGTVPADQFDETVFNQTEKENIVFIQKYIDNFSDGDVDYTSRGLAFKGYDAVPQLAGEYNYYSDPSDRNSLRLQLTVNEDGYVFMGVYKGEEQYQKSIIFTEVLNDMVYLDETGTVSFCCEDYGRIVKYDEDGGYSGTYTFLP